MQGMVEMQPGVHSGEQQGRGVPERHDLAESGGDAGNDFQLHTFAQTAQHGFHKRGDTDFHACHKRE